jgi:hypothetical protein
MKRALKRIVNNHWYFAGNTKIYGSPSGITGDLSYISGDVDGCEISQDERKNGVCIGDLIAVIEDRI